MKIGRRVRFGSYLSIVCITAFLLVIAPGDLCADGCFVVPKFVWDKHKDINEPNQKAIIVHEAGREELILQVKYHGPVEEFGWLIPVPNLPTVKKGSMECFYELSKFTQKHMEPRWMNAALSEKTHGVTEEPEPPIKVIEVKTVGAYDIAVLSAKNSSALENWLQENHFSLPPNAAGVIDSYAKQQWYFIAVRINLKESSSATTTKLASGELHPLQISFASERCVFPLKISSLNGTLTEVQLYVLSPEPLVERKMFEMELSKHSQWRTNMVAKRKEALEHLRTMRAGFAGGTKRIPTRLPVYQEEDVELSSRSEINTEKIIPLKKVGRKDIPVCSKEIALLNNAKPQWLTKQTWTFKPEEMHDLEFVPAMPVFTAALAHTEGALAAANLKQLGTSGVAALISAMQNKNPAVRAHATSAAENMFAISFPNRNAKDDEYSGQRELNPELLKLLPTLLSDPDPEVRLHAVTAAWNSGSPAFFNRMFEWAQLDTTTIMGL